MRIVLSIAFLLAMFVIPLQEETYGQGTPKPKPVPGVTVEDDGCWVDVKDPPKCGDDHDESFCEGGCSLKVVSKPGVDPIVKKRKCDDTPTYDYVEEDREINEVEEVFDFDRAGLDDTTKIKVTCVYARECTCDNLGDEGWQCTPPSDGSRGTPKTKVDGEKASGEVCPDEDDSGNPGGIEPVPVEEEDIK